MNVLECVTSRFIFTCTCDLRGANLTQDASLALFIFGQHVA